MDVIRSQRKYRHHQAAMLRERLLDDQFIQLQESGPQFVIEIVTMFLDESEKHLNFMAQALEQIPVNFQKLDYDVVHPFKGASLSIGAARVQNVCVNFRSFCEAQNLEGCRTCLQQLQYEYSLLKNNLQYFLRLQQEIQAAGGSIPTLK